MDTPLPYDEATILRAARAYTLYVAHLVDAGYPPLPRFADLPAPEQEAFCAMVQALTLAAPPALPDAPPPPETPQ